MLIFSWIVLVAAEQRPLRIASTSLCGDGYVLAVAPHHAIQALSWQSDDPLSTAPASFKDKPKAWDDPERLLALDPTLVIFGPGEGTHTKPFLDRAGIHHVTLEWGEDFASVNRNLDRVSSVCRLPPPRSGKHISNRKPAPILYVLRDGSIAGTGTFVDAAIRAAGGAKQCNTRRLAAA